MKVTLYDWQTALRDVRTPWAEMVARHPYNPSLHPDWLDATLQAWGLDRSASVATVHEDGRLRAVIPFLVRTRTVLGFPCRGLELCSNIFSYHAEILCDGDPTESLDAFLSNGRLPAWDVFRAVNVVADGSGGCAVRALALRTGTAVSVRQGEHSPYITIDRDWNSYLLTRAKKVRANISRSQRLMQDAGETGMTWYEAGCNSRQLLAEMLEIEAQSWKADAGVAIVAGTPQCAYYERLLPWLAANGIMANVLHVKARPVAYTLCAVWQGWVGQLKTSFASQLRDAGSRVIHSSLERAFRNGCREYDFLGDAAPHKMRWTDRTRAHEDLWLFAPHMRGRALAGIKRLSDRLHLWRETRNNDSLRSTNNEGAETQ